MNTATMQQPNILKKDCDGYWYSIPPSEEEMFVNLIEAIQNSEFMSEEWHLATDEFNHQFGGHMRATA